MSSKGLYASPEEFHKESFMGLSDRSSLKDLPILNTSASWYVTTTYAVAVSPSLPARPDS